MIDDIFSDCEIIANNYEEHLINVLIEFTRIELKYKQQMTSVPYNIILNDTNKYFKDKYDKTHIRVIEVK
jgi:hypothetical protein